MVIPHRELSIDINRPNQYTIDFIAHVGDKNTRYIDITFNADGEPIELEQGCVATVTYVSDGVLIEQEAECDVDGSTVIIGIDTGKVENLRSGILEIQPKIVDGSGNIIVSQIPVLVRISPDIAEHGRVDDDSLGSYAEVVREIAAARGSYTNLKERLDHTGAPTDEQVTEAVEDYLDEHPAVPNGNSIWKTSTAPTAPETSESPGYGFNISDMTGPDRDVRLGDMILYSYYYYTVNTIIGSVAYAESRVSIRGAKGATGTKGDDYVLTAQDKTEIAGMVDVTGKENTANKKTSISNQSQTGDSDTFYPTVGAVRNFVNLVKDDLEDYVDEEIGSIPEVTVDSAFSQASTNPVQNKIVTAKLNEIISGKADKSTTLSGYGITNAYTKTEVDYAIRTAIGGVENGSY